MMPKTVLVTILTVTVRLPIVLPSLYGSNARLRTEEMARRHHAFLNTHGYEIVAASLSESHEEERI
jgi:hypothetical protein